MNFTAIVRSAVRHRPDKEAVVAGKGIFTFRELWRRISAAAEIYRRHGLTAGDRVLFVLPNSPDFLFYHFGALQSGVVSVPVKADYRVGEVGQILRSCRPRLLVSDDRWVAEQGNLLSESLNGLEVLSVDCIDLDTVLDASAGTGDGPLAVLPNSAVASINYTYCGGGYPKGAVLTHANHIYAATGYARHMAFTSADRFLIVLPMAHVYALSGCVNAALVRGATLVILDRYTPKPIFEAIEAQRITVLSSVPAVFEILARFPHMERYDLSTLRICVTGGSYLPAPAQRNYAAALGTHMVQGYGLSECLPVICNPPDARNKPGTLGIPGRRDIHIRIVGTGGEILPPGRIGEIAIASPTTMRGYHALPEDTSAVLRDGWLYTGDLGSVDEDGFLRYHGIMKDILNIHGNKIDLGEVRAILRTYPMVAAAEVEGEGEEDPARFGMPSEIRASLTPTDGQGVDIAHLKAFLRRRLAAYKLPTKIAVRAGG